MKKNKEQAPREESPRAFDKKEMIAKKDFRIIQNDYDRQIKAGENLSDIPEKYLANLSAEGVL